MSWWKGQEENEEDNDDEEENEFKSGEDRIIFLIDARKEMFEKNKLGEVHLQNSISVALAVMKSKIIASSQSSVGVILFGTEKKDEGSSMDGVYTLFSASPPSAARIRQLQAMVDDIGIFHETIGSQKKGPYCPLNEAFWACSQAFNAKAQATAFDFRRIWLFTNDDNPNGHSASEQARIIQAARDCAESGIEVSLWHMNRTDGHTGRSVDFDPQKFYTKLLVAEGDEEEADSIDYRMKGAGYDGFDAMMASVRRKEHKKRSMGSLIFHLGDPATAKGVGVKLFKLVNPMKKPTHTWLYSRTNEPLKIVTKYIDGTTGETLEESRISTYIDVAGTAVPFTKEEKAEILQKGMHGAGIQLLYFASRSSFLPEINWARGPYFIFSDEKGVKGSTALLTSLIADLVKKGLMAVVRFARTPASEMRPAVMLPQEEVIDDQGLQQTPAGFHLIQLPYDDEVRGNPNPVSESAKLLGTLDKSVEAARKLVEAFVDRDEADGLDYRRYENPAIQRFYSVLQAVALMEEGPDWTPEQDTLRPIPPLANPTGDKKQALEHFKEALGIEDDIMALGEQNKKRAAGGGGGPAAKKVKAEPQDALSEDEKQEWKQAIADGRLEKQSVDQMKDFLRRSGLPVSGAKKVLMERIINALQ